MCRNKVLLMDTPDSGRCFDVRTGGVTSFATIQELRLLCQSALRQATPPEADKKPLCHPEKGKLVSLRISIFAVDQAGAHGTLHLSPTRRDTFKSTDELVWLINREIYLAVKKRQGKASGRGGANPAVADIPKTGDDTPLYLWLGVLLFALAGLIAARVAPGSVKKAKPSKSR